MFLYGVVVGAYIESIIRTRYDSHADCLFALLGITQTPSARPYYGPPLTTEYTDGFQLIHPLPTAPKS